MFSRESGQKREKWKIKCKVEKKERKDKEKEKKRGLIWWERGQITIDQGVSGEEGGKSELPS